MYCLDQWSSNPLKCRKLVNKSKCSQNICRVKVYFLGARMKQAVRHTLLVKAFTYAYEKRNISTSDLKLKKKLTPTVTEDGKENK